jgi:hypothetical protein
MCFLTSALIGAPGSAMAVRVRVEHPCVARKLDAPVCFGVAKAIERKMKRIAGIELPLQMRKVWCIAGVGGFEIMIVAS